MTILEWNSATEWDSAQSESGVTHEAHADTDHNDASTLQQGYSYTSFYRASDLVLLYAMDEDTDTAVQDLSGNTNDADLGSATANVPGLLGGSAWSFDGVDDDKYFNADTGPITSPPLTLIAWFNISSFQDSKVAGHKDMEYEMMVRDTDGDGTWNVSYRIADSSHNDFAGSTALSTDTWYMAALTYSSSGAMNGYLNGNQDASATLNGTLSGILAPQPWGIGSRESAFYFNGVVDTIALYSAELTQSEIQNLYNVVATKGSLTTAPKRS